MKNFPGQTFHLACSRTSPFLRGLTGFLLTFLIVVFALEAGGRSPLGNRLPAPSVQGDSFLFDAKVYALEQQARRNGRLDCIFIGSSVTNSDIDPQALEQVYFEQTGEPIHCFNFGYPAMTVENAAVFADSVIAKFSPRLIVYTFIPRDVIFSDLNVDFLQQSAWLQTHPRDLHDWLIQNSYAYRYYQTWRYLLLPPNREKRVTELTHLTDKGFQPTYDIRDPYPQTINFTVDLLAQTAATDYTRRHLKQLLARQDDTVHILLVEAPIYREAADAALWQAYENEYIPLIEELAHANNTAFIRTAKISSAIPRPHWYDHLHLNFDGALTFSRWLGGVLASRRGLPQ
ncbi:MAG: hypothetical protein HFACDABA_01811 [Anaerolineales bacterium]|nr:hypothetical protein [Anaerolineales bacterium]